MDLLCIVDGEANRHGRRFNPARRIAPDILLSGNLGIQDIRVPDVLLTVRPNSTCFINVAFFDQMISKKDNRVIRSFDIYPVFGENNLYPDMG